MRPSHELLDESDAPGWIAMSDALILTTVFLIGIVFSTIRYARAEHGRAEGYAQRISILEGMRRRIAELEKDNAKLRGMVKTGRRSESEIKKLEATLIEALRERDRLRTALAAVEAERDSLKDHLAAAEKRLAASEAERIRLLSNLNSAWEIIADIPVMIEGAVSDARRGEKLLRQELLGVRGRGGKLKRVVFVIDRSGSMTFPPGSGHYANTKRDAQESTRRWEYVRGIVQQWLDLLPFEEVGLVFFNDEVSQFPKAGEYLSVGKAEEKTALIAHLNSLKPEGDTNTFAALQAAFEYPDSDAIIMFTDGSPTKSPLKNDPRGFHDQVLDLVRSRDPSNSSPINVIGIGDYFANINESGNRQLTGGEQRAINLGRFLQDIADISGGAFIGK
jgi:hypothetical protein